MLGVVSNIIVPIILLLVYSPFSDRVALPLHNLSSPSRPLLNSSSVISTSTFSTHAFLGLQTSHVHTISAYHF